jgi:hypothetical protein
MLSVIRRGLNSIWPSNPRGTLPVPGAPVNTSAPVISYIGGLTPGEIIVCDVGTWIALAPTYFFQWKSDTTNVGGNTNSYIIQASDSGKSITCAVTCIGARGTSTTVASNAIAIP